MSRSSQALGRPEVQSYASRIAIVFDLDGTLVDSRIDIAAATNHALGKHGFRTLSVPEIASYVGDGARPLLARAAQLEPEAAALEPLLHAFLSYYAAHPTDSSQLLPGASEALAELEHLPLALCTNKPRSITNAVLGNLGLTWAFSVVIAGGDLPSAKPDPLPLQYIAQKLGLSPSQLVMVGDGPQDILCAKAAGARSVGVTGGLQAPARLLALQPDALLKTLAELPALIRRWLAPP
jgi:phosphoglycolate phosphatase